MNAVASSLGAHVDDWIALAGGARVENLIATNQAECECIQKRVIGVAGFEFGFAAEVGYSEAVAVGGDPGDHTFEDGVVLMKIR